MSALGGSKCTVSIGKSIGGMSSVRCIEVVRFSEGPLLEVLLYTSMDRDGKSAKRSATRYCL